MDLPALPIGVTAVTGVRLYSNEERTGDAVSPPVALVAGQWTVDTLNVPDGRWWASVDAMKDAVPYAYPLRDPIDLPEDDRLVISPEVLADSIDMPLPLSRAQRSTLRRAILEAQSDVVAYLGQPILPQQYVERGLYAWGSGWDLREVHPDDVIRIISTVPEVDPYGDGTTLGDTWTVTYLAGMDAREEEYEPIRRFILAHAANSNAVTRIWRETVQPAKVIKSSSTEGQSVSYEVPTLGGGGAAGSGIPGSLPTLNSLSLWRVAGRRVYQAPTRLGERYGR